MEQNNNYNSSRTQATSIYKGMYCAQAVNIHIISRTSYTSDIGGRYHRTQAKIYTITH